MHASELWDSPELSARLARAALTPASWLYALGWETYLGVYRLGLKRPAEPHRPVVCVGGLRAGGVGKTPVTRHIASVLKEAGHEVVVSCSGYGSRRSADASLAPDGPLSAAEWGDEPAMLRWLEPDLPLVVGRNRVAAARLVHQSRPGSVLLLDDGFQHLPLRKHVSLVLEPAEPSNPRCLPAGPYREPRRHSRRADLVLPDGFRVVPQPLRLVSPEGMPMSPQAYAVVCALGDPRRFLADLESAFPNRQNEVAPRLLPDHDPLRGGTLFEALPPQFPIVATAKDWVKLRERHDLNGRSFLVATHDVRIEPAPQFRQWIEQKLNESQ